jgi:hypothetical protein
MPAAKQEWSGFPGKNQGFIGRLVRVFYFTKYMKGYTKLKRQDVDHGTGRTEL